MTGRKRASAGEKPAAPSLDAAEAPANAGETAPPGESAKAAEKAPARPRRRRAPARKPAGAAGAGGQASGETKAKKSGEAASTVAASVPDAVPPAGAESAPPAGKAGAETPGEPGDSAKRRRGTRGGRRRHKAKPLGSDEAPRGGEPVSEPVAAVTSPAAGTADVTEAPGEGASPETEVAGAGASRTGGSAEGEQSDDEAPARRRRRGSRGGRRHHKATEAGVDEAVGETIAPGAGLEPETPPRGESAGEASAAGEAVPAEAEAAEGVPVRKRRSRGGRGRRGAGRAGGAASAGAESFGTAPLSEQGEGESPAAAPEAAAEVEAPAAAEESGEGEEPRQQRRRGARGGRRARSKRKPAVSDTAEGDDADSADEPEAIVAAEEEDAPPDVRPARSRRARAAAQVAADEAEEPGEVVGRDARRRATAEPEPAAGGGAAKPRRRDHRRPAAIVRQDEGGGLSRTTPETARRRAVVAEQPKSKVILVSDDGHELRVALVEDGRLAEIYIERPEQKSYLGDIYQGKVDNVMHGIDAAFVDFGLEKNGFLYVDEVMTGDGEKHRGRRIGDVLKKGQQVLVQVTKDPMGHKGARLSMKISLAGRYLVYVPGGSGVGVSRRLGQAERDRLRDVSKKLKPKNAGLIIRTIAEGHDYEDLHRDMLYLSRLWSRLKKKAESVKPPGLVHKEVDVSIEAARDLFNDSCESMIIDDAKRHKAIVAFLDKEAPELLPKVHRHTGSEPLFDTHGIEDQIARALERRVPLPSGGNLVIDHAEALTVIDVNSGRFAGGKGLEETITHTNLEAAREVVHQLRLRDIGGIIVIDFIDMSRTANREMVLATLEAELENDRTKTYVVELSPLGLVEMTRQNTTDGARGVLTRSCPACNGKARVLSNETMALQVERRVRTHARRSQAKAFLVELNAGVAERLTAARVKQLEKETGRNIFIEGASSLPVDAFRVVAEGSVAHVQEQRVPVGEGDEVEVELEFSLTYSPRDAVGYVDGYMVIVEGGRQFLGERRKVRVTSTARTGAGAVVVKGTN